MKSMCRHQTLIGISKQFPKKLNQAPPTICYTAKIKAVPKIINVDITKLQTGELICVDFALYNVTSFYGFTSVFTIVCARIIMFLVFLTASKRSPVLIIRFVPTTLENEQHPCKCARVDEYGALENSKDDTSLLVDASIISMETTGVDASCLNGKN